VSFGWKDAFANAILYSALRVLAPALREFGLKAEAAELYNWAEELKRNYTAAFWNEKTGWFAGWRCQRGELHDHAFLAVNGAAVCAGLVEPDRAKALLQRLLAEAKRVGMPDAALGLPGNLRSIPDSDLADIMQGYPLGYYKTAAAPTRRPATSSWRSHHVGLTHEADVLLERLCAGFADALVFGGNQSGVDWRYWDDRPCGYEGLLTAINSACSNPSSTAGAGRQARKTSPTSSAQPAR